MSSRRAVAQAHGGERGRERVRASGGDSGSVTGGGVCILSVETIHCMVLYVSTADSIRIPSDGTHTRTFLSKMHRLHARVG